MDAYELIHRELTRIGVKLAATLPDDWVGPLIGRVDADPAIRHVPVARDSEAGVIATVLVASPVAVVDVGVVGGLSLRTRRSGNGRASGTQLQLARENLLRAVFGQDEQHVVGGTAAELDAKAADVHLIHGG